MVTPQEGRICSTEDTTYPNSIIMAKGIGPKYRYRLEVPIGPIGYLDWNCYRKRVRRLKREAKGLPMLVSRKGETHSEKRARLNALQWAKRRALKPEEPPEPPRRCIEVRFVHDKDKERPSKTSLCRSRLEQAG